MSEHQRDQDGDLRARFAALRREEADHAPEFVRPSMQVEWKPQRAKRPGARMTAAVALAALTIAWFGAVLRHSTTRKARLEARGGAVSLADWKAPTGFLLETPGGELLRTVPAFGVQRNGAAVAVRRERKSWTRN